MVQQLTQCAGNEFQISITIAKKHIFVHTVAKVWRCMAGLSTIYI